MPPPKQPLESVLITGGCGFVAYNLITQILETEPTCKITAFDVNTSRPSRRHESVTYIRGDISKESAIDAAIAAMNPPPRVIFHMATPPSMETPDYFHWLVSVQGTRNLLSAVANVKSVRALVLTSTPSVTYDGVAEMKDVKELPVLDASKQSRAYSRSKALCETEVLAANRKDGSGMLTCALRQCTTFGPDDEHFYQNMVDVVKKGQARFRFGKGENLFDFIYVGNAAYAHILAARALLAAYGKDPLPASQRVEGEVFNISNDERIPFWDIVIRTSNLLGRPLSHDQIFSIPPAVGILIAFLVEWLVWILTLAHWNSKMTREGVRYTYLNHTMDISKAKERLQYAPRWSIQEGLERSADWYKEKDKKQ